uniref:Uncharacterized protein n=1 Tax=Pseudomonas aeruginosa TaxID=287 RepID=A0A2L1KF45_PSEAI|nr:Hypothetical protein [Pseudomonas aeruginosa]
MRSYQSALAYWSAWLQLRITGRSATAPTVEVAMQFIVAHLAHKAGR